MKKIILLMFTVSALTVSAQKTIIDPNVEKRAASGFHAIVVSGGIDLYLSPGEETVAVSASETKYRDRIKTEVKNGVLKIWYDNSIRLNIEWGNRKLKAYVSFKNLDEIVASGGSDISVEGSIKVNTLSLGLSGGSDFEGKVEVNNLSANASGGSDFNISGLAKNVSIITSGGSDFKGYELTADMCDVEASGGSDTYITVEKELTAHASGGSDVSYKGNALVKEMKSSGSSSIKKIGK